MNFPRNSECPFPKSELGRRVGGGINLRPPSKVYYPRTLEEMI